MKSEFKNNVCTIFLEGRIDSANAGEREAEIVAERQAKR